MINAGLARHYKKYRHEQSAWDRLLYSDAEEKARLRRSGLWLDAIPTPPWDWRKGEANQRLTPEAITAVGQPLVSRVSFTYGFANHLTFNRCMGRVTQEQLRLPTH